jgi:hypothetical protein
MLQNIMLVPRLGLTLWEYVKIYLKETAWVYVNLVYLAQGRCLWWGFVNILMHLRFHKMPGIS